MLLRVSSGVSTPKGSWKAPLAERVQTRQEFGLPVVEAQLAARASVHQTDGSLLLQPLLLRGQTLGLVLHDDDNIVVVNVFDIFIHFQRDTPRPSLSANQYSFALGNKG